MKIIHRETYLQAEEIVAFLSENIPERHLKEVVEFFSQDRIKTFQIRVLEGYLAESERKANPAFAGDGHDFYYDTFYEIGDEILIRLVNFSRDDVRDQELIYIYLKK